MIGPSTEPWGTPSGEGHTPLTFRGVVVPQPPPTLPRFTDSNTLCLRLSRVEYFYVSSQSRKIKESIFGYMIGDYVSVSTKLFCHYAIIGTGRPMRAKFTIFVQQLLGISLNVYWHQQSHLVDGCYCWQIYSMEQTENLLAFKNA